MKGLWLFKQNYNVYPNGIEKGAKHSAFYVHKYTKHDYLRLTDVTVKLCQKYPVRISLLLANMLASYTLKGSAGKHFRVFWRKKRLCYGKCEKGCSAGRGRLEKQSHLPFHKLHRYNNFEVIRLSVFQLQHTQ